ncbi:MAG: heme ABC transporter permease CcmC [Sphingosinicella sp.]
MHALANPARFLRLARPLTWSLGWIGALLIAGSLFVGLWLAPPDRLQGESARILYVHVPSAWLGMAGWAAIAGASLAQLVWRHPLAAVAGRAIAFPGALFTFLCLATGSLWGRPAWGTWWEWDGRMTSMLVLLFIYFAYLALVAAEREKGAPGRMSAIFGLVGAANLPIIHYSVQWWNTLHQGQSIDFLRGTSNIAAPMLWPLLASALGFSLLFAAIVLMRMRTELATNRVEARLKRLASE